MTVQRFLLHLVVSLTVLAAQPVLASAPPSCIAATLSANAEILVINDLILDTPDEKTFGRKILASTFRVLRRHRKTNDEMHLNGPDTYWTDPLWSVTFDDRRKSPFIFCPYTLVTDDGEFLILLGGLPAGVVIHIYRRPDHPGQPSGGPGPDQGVLIREIPIGALWPKNRIPSMYTDHTPPWFAFGSLAFSSDNRTLIYKTQWATTLKINLLDGAVAAQ